MRVMYPLESILPTSLEINKCKKRTLFWLIFVKRGQREWADLHALVSREGVKEARGADRLIYSPVKTTRA